ncbi:hypothetical protein G7Y89_g12377 [Cudoniella acicularis]|uniref:FAD-binding FR-type domain-containing protein n=1 Tax=Cudoniella acicularis TaxID=354080 RepID=A0A8H4RAJ4_9HELO|nr:hypothetical protein G7Y89_g12377 [Cudoniella acicularis]
MANSTAATSAARAKQAIAKALQQRNNENSVKFFATGMVGLMLIFIISHFCRVLYMRFRSKSSGNRTLKALIGPLGVFSLEGAFVNVDYSTLNGWAKRLGWVAAGNIALVTFLALKNTPLAFLTAYSYERLNVLHRIGGYATVFWSILHAVVYIVAEAKGRDYSSLQEEAQIMGIVAGFSMLIILVTALLLRKLQYEVFYIIHIIMFILILITVGMHRPNPSTKTVYIMVFSAAIWVADRLVRFLKISYFTFGNSATITPLPHGGTRIILRKSPKNARAGSHCFLWIPGVRATETHPFTITSTKPLELVVKAHDGFTRDLHAAALSAPGQVFKASIDGPYSTVPDFSTFNKIVFIAGGSGASYTFGVALELLRKPGQLKCAIEFIWVVKDKEMTTWFGHELTMLYASPLVNLRIHSTQSSSSEKPTSIPSPTPSSPISPTSPKSAISSFQARTIPSRSDSTASSYQTLEKRFEGMVFLPEATLPIKTGRPDVAGIIKGVVDGANGGDRIAVAACGPDEMMRVVRRTAASNMKPDGPALELFCEQFGW